MDAKSNEQVMGKLFRLCALGDTWLTGIHRLCVFCFRAT